MIVIHYFYILHLISFYSLPSIDSDPFHNEIDDYRPDNDNDYHEPD